MTDSYLHRLKPSLFYTGDVKIVSQEFLMNSSFDFVLFLKTKHPSESFSCFKETQNNSNLFKVAVIACVVAVVACCCVILAMA